MEDFEDPGFAVVRETEVKTEVLFKGTERECWNFLVNEGELFFEKEVDVQEMA